MAPAKKDSGQLLTLLLRDVARSFYLTMRVLPGAIRPQISLAYLLARATDTIADTEIVPVEERLHALDHLRDRILGQTATPLDFVKFRNDGALSPTRAAEAVLLSRAEDALALLAAFTPEDQQLIRDVLATITSGQALDLQRFGGAEHSAGAGNPNLTALQTDAELEDYTYRVAGCVGEFWTRLCRVHLFPQARLDAASLLADGIRFGKGLQLVNVLRDLPADLRRGRCYLPLAKLSTAGLAPADLLDPANEPRLRPLYRDYLALAEAHLAAGWAYTNRLPAGQVRVRLACAWPVLIGLRTLAKLRAGRVLDPTQRIKVSRAEIRHILMRSLLAYPWPHAWRNLFSKMGN